MPGSTSQDSIPKMLAALLQVKTRATGAASALACQQAQPRAASRSVSVIPSVAVLCHRLPTRAVTTTLPVTKPAVPL
eukprot:927042-Rhodomonas_salina.1